MSPPEGIQPVLYMVIEYFNAGAAPEIYRRARERGRQLPPGLERAEDRSLFDAWIEAWSDVAHFEVIPVRPSAEAARLMAGGA
jgi:hypothetical protein